MPSMNDKDYYKILGVSSDASTDEIRKAFQQKARKYHPDVNKAPGAEQRFKEISEAYAVLSDPDKRRRYDAMHSGSVFASQGASAPGAGYGGPQGQDPFWDFEQSYWGWPFGGMGQRRQQKRSRSFNPKAGSDFVYHIDLDAATAKKGTKRGITYQHYVQCQNCHGHGSVVSDHPETCPTCGGTGHISVDLDSLFGFGEMDMVCPECEGTGKVVVDPCPACGGTGRVLAASEVVVMIPPKSHDGDEVRIKGMGNAGTNGEASGDFVLRVGVPTERLAPRQAVGFQFLGFDIPFLILSLIADVFAALAPFIIVLAAVGFLLILTGGSRPHNSKWWNNAGTATMNGVLKGLFVAILIVAMVSCTSSFGSTGYSTRVHI